MIIIMFSLISAEIVFGFYSAGLSWRKSKKKRGKKTRGKAARGDRVIIITEQQLLNEYVLIKVRNTDPIKSKPKIPTPLFFIIKLSNTYH